jgi:hypothetical protein
LALRQQQRTSEARYLDLAGALALNMEDFVAADP